MNQDAEAILARAHQAVTNSAATSKRAVAAHRRDLIEANKAKAELENYAQTLGLNLVTETAKPEGKANDAAADTEQA